MSAIPAVIDHLVSRLPNVLPDIQVIDGPPLVELQDNGVAVGYDPDMLSAEAQEEGAGLDTNVETFDIHCLAWSTSGDAQMKAVRDGVYAIVGAVDAFLGNDRRLGGAVTFAQLRVLDLDQSQNKDGTWAVVAFAITCKAFK